MVKKYQLFIFLFLLLLPSVWFLLLPGFFESDDGEWMVIRFSAFYQAFADGQFPVRFLGRLNHGYGYPVANFLYPGFMYFAVPLHILGLSFVNSIKVVLILSMVGAGFYSYFWLSRIFNRFSALVGSLFITYTPYHLFDLYKRGSVGELFAFVWVPFILWMIEAKNTFFISIGIFLLAISHNTMFLLFMPLLFAYSLVRKTNSVKETVVSFIFGILMSSFFTIPAIYDLQFTNFATTKISDVSQYFVDFGLIGLSTFTVLVLSSFVFLKNKKNDLSFIFFFIISVLSIFLSISLSEPLWRFLPSSFIQFPFRFLSYLIFSIGFLSAFVVFYLKKQTLIIAVVIIIFLVFSSYKYIEVRKVFRDDSFYSTNEATTTVQDEYIPRWVKQKPTEHFKNKVEIVEGDAGVTGEVHTSNSSSFTVIANGESIVRLNTVYYPGWEARVNGQPTMISYSNNTGVMEIGVPAGSNNVKLIFGETPIRLGADILSVLSFALLILYQRKTRGRLW